MTDNTIGGRADTNIGRGERLGSWLAGIVLIGRALSRPTWGRVAAAVGGAVLLKRAVTGHCEVKAKLGIGRDQPQRAADRRRARRNDPVLEASEESFPASDPPAWTPVAGSVARD